MFEDMAKRMKKSETEIDVLIEKMKSRFAAEDQ
jgi:uncharacterized protein YukE